MPNVNVLAALAVAAAWLIPQVSVLAAEDCYNGPVPVNGAERAQISVPKGQAVRLTFDFNAA